LALWAIVIERQLYVIREETIKVLPQGSNPVRVLQIGDIHLAPWQKNKMRFLKSLSEKQIDLVVNTGDNLGHKDAIKPLLDALGPLLTKTGVFVHGSNDYYAPALKNPFGYLFRPSVKPEAESVDQGVLNPATLNTKELTAGFESAGWHNLNNQSAEITVSGNKIRFIGIDDFHIGLSDLGTVQKNDQFTIALTHAPYLQVIEKFTQAEAKLIFAGHTHGGQVRLPFIGALTTNSDLPNKFARGVSGWEFGENNSILSVVAGLGNSIFAPVRFFCRPEVRLITLTPVD
jgi:predicted MPP superfamily phosphohydrolase